MQAASAGPQGVAHALLAEDTGTPGRASPPPTDNTVQIPNGSDAVQQACQILLASEVTRKAEQMRQNLDETVSPDLFISHCSRDSGTQARKFSFIEEIGNDHEDEGKQGYTYWADFRQLQARGPVDWLKEIEDAIEASAKFVAFVDSQYLCSHNCIIEVYMAMKLKKPVVPVLLDNKAWHVLTHPNTALEAWENEGLWKHEGCPMPSGKEFSFGMVEEVFAHLSSISFCSCRVVDVELHGWNAIVANLRSHLSKDLLYLKEWTDLQGRATRWDSRNRGMSLLLTGDEIFQWQAWCQHTLKHGTEPAPTPLQEKYVYESGRAAQRGWKILLFAIMALMVCIMGLGIAATAMAIKSEQGKVFAEKARDFAENAREYAELQQQDIFVSAIESQAQSELSKAIMLINHPSESLRLRCKTVQHASILAAEAGRLGVVAPHVHSLVERVTLEEEYLYYKLPAGKGRTRSIEYHRRDLLAYGGDDGRVFIINMSHMIVPDEYRITKLDCMSRRSIVFDLSWSSSGNTLAAGLGASNSVCIWQESLEGGWDLRASLGMTGATPECSGASWLNHSDVLAVAYSPAEDDLLAVASTNGALYLWDVAQQPPAVVRTMRHCNMTHFQHLKDDMDARRVTSAPPHTSVLAWLDDGRHLLSAGTGNALELWDTTLDGAAALVVSHPIADDVVLSISATPHHQRPGEYHVAVSGLASRNLAADYHLLEFTLIQRSPAPAGWELIHAGLHPTSAPAVKLVPSPDGEALMTLEMGPPGTKSIEFVALREGKEAQHQDLLSRFEAEMANSQIIVRSPSAGAWVIRDVRANPWEAAFPAETVIFNIQGGFGTDTFLNPDPRMPELSASSPDGEIFVAQKAVGMGNGGPRSFNLECNIPEMSILSEAADSGDPDDTVGPGQDAWQISRDGSKVAATQNWNGRGTGICLWRYDLTNGYENTGNIWVEAEDERSILTIHELKLSPDGTRLLVLVKHKSDADKHTVARMYDTSSWTPRLMYISPYYWTKRNSCEWTPDSKFLLCSTSPKISVFWRAESPPGPSDLQLSHDNCGMTARGIALQELKRDADGGAMLEAATNCVDKTRTACSVQFWELHVDGSGEVNLASVTHVARISHEGNVRCAWAEFSSDSKLGINTVEGQVTVLTRDTGNSSSWQQHDVMNLKDGNSIPKGIWAPDGKSLVVVEGTWWQHENPLAKVELDNDDLVASEVWQLGGSCPLAIGWLPAFTWPLYQSRDRIMCLSYVKQGDEFSVIHESPGTSITLRLLPASFKQAIDLLGQVTFGRLDESDVKALGIQEAELV